MTCAMWPKVLKWTVSPQPRPNPALRRDHQAPFAVRVAMFIRACYSDRLLAAIGFRCDSRYNVTRAPAKGPATWNGYNQQSTSDRDEV